LHCIKRLLPLLLAAALILPGSLESALAQQATPSEEPSATEEPPRPAALVVDIAEVMRGSAAMSVLREQLDTRRAALIDEFASDEVRLRAAFDELREQQSVMDPDVFAAEADELEDQMLAIERRFNDETNGLEQALSRVQSDVRERAVRIIGQVADERGVRLVVPRQATVLFDQRLNITSEVIERLNAEFPRPLPDSLPD